MTSRAHRRPARVLVVLSLTAPLAALLAVGSTAPASASSSITAPAANTIYTSGTSTTVSASLDPCAGTTLLKVVAPDGSNSWQVQSSRPSSCDGLFPPSQRRSLSVKPTWTADSRNGEFTATLSGGVSSTLHFYTNQAPTADPANLAAAAVGRTEVDLSWAYSGTESDKAGFEIVETSGGSSRTLTAPASACSGSSCGFAITYPEPPVNTTEDFSYTVRALRSSCGTSACGDYTRSASSSAATAQLVGPPPPPSPTPTPSASGGTTGSTTGSTAGGSTGSTTGSTGSTTGGSTGGTSGGSTGGTTGSKTSTSGGTSASKPIVVPTLPPLVASRRAFALGFNHFSPSLGIPKLPPLPATTFPETAPGAEGYQPTLPYKAQPRKTTSVLSSPIAAITDSVDTAQLAKSLAVALILLGAAAHVRLFLSHSAED